MDGSFDELAQQSPTDRFHRWMEKDSRRYELLVLVVEACYLVLYWAYVAFILATAPEDMARTPKPFFPVLIVVLRAGRLFGCCCRPQSDQVKSSCRWGVDTLFHCVVLSWYGLMAGLFSVMSLTPASGDFFLKGMYIGPTVYIFLLTALSLTVLDPLQTLLASMISFVFYGVPLTVFMVPMLAFEDHQGRGNGYLLVGMEQLTLLIAVCALCLARWSSWSDRKATFRREESLKSGIIDEKLKRCQVEFAAQQLIQPSTRREDGAESILSATSRKKPPSAVSAQTAPPNPDRLALLQGESPRCDCLPMSSKVHVDGCSSGGKLASQLLLGDRVLCYDHLSGSIKFVEVEDCEVISGPCSWSRVTLSDGTTMSVTADHPVRVMGETFAEADGKGVFGLGGGRVVPAGELRPGKDMLKILRMGAVTVQDMQIEPDHQPRVRVNLRQSWRYSLFCTQGVGPDATSVAVESSCGLQGRQEEMLQVQNTFLRVAEQNSDVVAVRKARSDPGAITAEDQQDRAAIVLEIPAEPADGPATEDSDAVGDAPGASSMSSSDGNPDLQHAQGRCQPCLFQSRYFADPERFPACSKPDCLARYCHLPHSEDYLAAYKANKRRYEKRNRFAARKRQWTPEEQEGPGV